MLKRIIALITAIIICFAFSACGGENSGNGGNSKNGNYSGVSVNDVLIAIEARFDSVIGIEIGTEENDHNNLLGKANQYIELGWFMDERAIPAWLDPIEFETSTGGTLEKFATEANAKNRYDYLLGFTGMFQNYCELHGVYVVRLSSELTASQQREYFNFIKETLDDLN
jgi:hypothetical protein